MKYNFNVGDQYNDWTVISNERRKLYGKNAGVLVKCKCGLQKVVSCENLIYERSKCCVKCSKKLKIINVNPGEVYGNWTVLSNELKGGKKMLAQCKCGKKTWVTKYGIINKVSTGCYNCGVEKRYKGTGNLSLTYFSCLASGAKKRNLEFAVTIQELWELFLKQEEKCALTGTIIGLSSNITAKRQTASLDRIDSTKGYTNDNVQWVHKDINKIKNNTSEELFIQMCEKIVKHSCK
mgnify:CR=1 FL=1